MNILPEVHPLNESTPSTRRSSAEYSQNREHILIEHTDSQRSQSLSSGEILAQNDRSARRQAAKDLMNESPAHFTYLHQKAAVKDCIFDKKNRADKKQ